MRTFEEIAERAKTCDDIFGTASDLILFLPFEHAKQFLKEEVTEESWKEDLKELTKENIISEMKGYMDFAWDKALGERGLSSNRNICHYKNWLWLLKDFELLEFIEIESNYPEYGKPILKKICEEYDFPIKECDKCNGNKSYCDC